MGLDLICGDMDIRAGSYSAVHLVRIYLLETIKNYLIKNDEDNSLIKDIEDLHNGTIIDYEKYDKIRTMLIIEDLNGFDCFINHSNGVIHPNNASLFVNQCDKLYDYFDRDEYYFDNNQFYLYEIFKHSSDTCEDIIFC